VNSKQYLNKVKAERDDWKSSAEYWQRQFNSAQESAKASRDIWEARLRSQQQEFNTRAAEMQSALNIERQMALQISAERERGKITEDRRFDFLVNTVVATAIATAQNASPRPAGVVTPEFPGFPEGYPANPVDKPIRLGTPSKY